MKRWAWAAMLFGLLWCWAPWTMAQPSPAAPGGNDTGMLQQFNQEVEDRSVKSIIQDRSRHRILFAMGISLLVLILITAVLGVSMVLFGKRVFVPHMIFAGLSVSLAIAHAIAAIVWFFPF